MSIIWPEGAHDEHSFASADTSCYFATKFLSLWTRLFVTFVVVVETFMIHANGKVDAKRSSKVKSRWIINLGASGFVSLSVYLLFTLSVESTGSYYACMYQFSHLEIYTDIVMLAVEVILCIFVLYVLLYKVPGGNSITNAMGNFEEPFLEEKHSSSLQTEQVSSGDSVPNNGGSPLATNHDKKKCKITGDFRFKMKIFIGFYVVGHIVSLLDGIQAVFREGAPRTDYIQFLSTEGEYCCFLLSYS